MSLISFFVGLFVSCRSDGAILFLNLNNSYKEIEVVEAHAKQVGEELVIFPNLSKDDAEKLKSTSKRIEKNQKEYTEKSCSRFAICRKAPSAECDSLSKGIKSDAQSLSEFQKRGNPAELKRVVKYLADNKAAISTIVVSGHSGGDGSSGVTGALRMADVADAFRGHRELAEGVKALNLWGCYSGTPKIMGDWKNIFPNTALMAGFDGIAPANDKLANFSYLDGSLKRQSELISANTEATLKDSLDKIEGVKLLNYSMCNNNLCLTNSGKKEGMDAPADMEGCERTFPKKALEAYLCYYEANEGCRDVPKDTKNSELRSLYTWMKRNQKCLTPKFKQKVNLWTSQPDRILNLLHYRNIVENFERKYRVELAQYNSLLKKMGLPPEARIENLSSLSRAEIISRLSKVDKLIKKFKNEPWAHGLRTWHRFINPTLKHMWCVPFDWVEPNSQLESKCAPHESLGVNCD